MPDIERKNERKKVLLGLTGGVAAYKAAELVRRLAERGIDVQVVMTRAACGFITPATLQALSGNPVYTDMWDARIPNAMAHIELTRDKRRHRRGARDRRFHRQSSRTASRTTCCRRCAWRATAR